MGQRHEWQISQLHHSMANVKSTNDIFTFLIFDKVWTMRTIEANDANTHTRKYRHTHTYTETNNLMAIGKISHICLKRSSFTHYRKSHVIFLFPIFRAASTVVMRNATHCISPYAIVVCVYVWACVRACVRECVSACVRACVRAYVCVCMCLCMCIVFNI